MSAGVAAPFRLSTCAGERKDQLEARPELASGRLQTSALIRKSQTRWGADKQTPTSRWSQIRATSALGAPFLLNCPVSCQLFSFLLLSPPQKKKNLPGQLHCRIFAFGLCSFMLPRGPLPFREPQFPSLADGEESGLSGSTCGDRSGVEYTGGQTKESWSALGHSCMLLAFWGTMCAD